MLKIKYCNINSAVTIQLQIRIVHYDSQIIPIITPKVCIECYWVSLCPM